MSTMQKSDSTDTLALVFELVFGFLLGTLGVGWLYAGNIRAGLLALFGYIVLVWVEVVVVVVTGGLAACLVLPVNIAIVIFSGVKVRDYVRNTGATGHPLYLVAGLLVPILLACGIIALLTILGPAIGTVFEEITRNLDATVP